MNRIIVVGSIMIIMLGLFACKQKAAETPNIEIEQSITTFAPLPSFREVYSALDQIQVRDISAAVPSSVYKTRQEEVRNAFSLGLLTADAVLAAKGQDKDKLIDISTQMMNLTSLLGLESEVNRLGDELKTMIEREDWENLNKALDQHKADIESKLWENENFDDYTLMLLGGWIEAANRVAWLIHEDYSADRSKVLAQKGTFNSLVSNLEQISTPYIVDQEAFQEALALTKEIQAIIQSHDGSGFTKSQLQKIIQKTDQIKAAFQR
nr:hypothetical protein [Candidatus Cloacimonadota bacterium]